MATKTLYFTGIENNWHVSYYFMTQAGYDYTVTLSDKDTGYIYYTWSKPYDPSGAPHSTANIILYTGSSGNLICTVDCPQSTRLEFDMGNSDITANGGKITLGKTYTAAFEDYGGSIDFNDLFVSIAGWKFYE
ncbi:hypothetical protein [Xenorhabdus kozodoii]|uniref:Uncharacterized protein n=1 Tax=Xenorhabdus kozodoii TaxID=351676 RepID=A0A2D0LJ10_9GAMM|nr:hypothetical protein [Xenorhabdus kozodoii]PHM75177.1 hypothetical protein Xkoz_00190 [Xenorhabdus kozodoii]